MSSWPNFLSISDALASDCIDARFTVVADRLLNGTQLLVAGQPYRLIEIEFYLFTTDHPDPFSHRNPLQLQCGRWCFHRTGGSYRNGSFKGLDLSVGNSTAFGGILIRSILKPDGTLINGPSRCVDHLLSVLRMGSVAELDRVLAGRLAWDGDNPLSLWRSDALEHREIIRTARVGLSLKRAKAASAMTRYLMLPYRFLSEPWKIGKGKRHTVLAMHIGGDDMDKIRRVTGCPRTCIQRYIEAFEAGRREGDFALPRRRGGAKRMVPVVRGVAARIRVSCS